MRLYEFEAKRLFAKHGIPVPKGSLAKTAPEAEKAAAELGCPVVLKAQVLSGATKPAAVRSVETPAQAKQAAEQLLALDDGGRKPSGVLVEKHPSAGARYSLAATYDGTRKLPVVAASDIAGNLDQIADEKPDRVARRHFSALFPFSDYQAKELVAALGLKGSDLTRMTGIVSRLAQLFLRYDLTQADVFSLARLDDGQFVALDVHMDVEVEGRSRQKAMLDELGIAPDRSAPGARADPVRDRSGEDRRRGSARRRRAGGRVRRQHRPGDRRRRRIADIDRRGAQARAAVPRTTPRSEATRASRRRSGSPS